MSIKDEVVFLHRRVVADHSLKNDKSNVFGHHRT